MFTNTRVTLEGWELDALDQDSGEYSAAHRRVEVAKARVRAAAPGRGGADLPSRKGAGCPKNSRTLSLS